MSEKSFEILTGAIVLVITVLFLTFTFRTTGLDSARNVYNLDTSFRSAEGINIGIRKLGVINLNKCKTGLVNLTNIFMKKKFESSL